MFSFNQLITLQEIPPQISLSRKRYPHPFYSIRIIDSKHFQRFTAPLFAPRFCENFVNENELKYLVCINISIVSHSTNSQVSFKKERKKLSRFLTSLPSDPHENIKSLSLQLVNTLDRFHSTSSHSRVRVFLSWRREKGKGFKNFHLMLNFLFQLICIMLRTLIPFTSNHTIHSNAPTPSSSCFAYGGENLRCECRNIWRTKR